MKLLNTVIPFATLTTMVAAMPVSDSLPRDLPEPTVGRLFVLASDGSYNGYIAFERDDKGRYVVDSDPSQAVYVTYEDHRLIPFVSVACGLLMCILLYG
jgi:hypothetical protein